MSNSNRIWSFYLYLFVISTVKYSEGQCLIESVLSSTQTYGNYYDPYGNLLCCTYTFQPLYDYINCDYVAATTEQDLINLVNLSEMSGFVDKRKYNVTYIKFTISHLPTIYVGTFNDFETLTELYINASFVQNIQPGAFNHLQYLKTLQLDQNNITEITRGVFNHLTNLVSLNLSCNTIETLENNSFLGLNKLQVLLLSYNKLKFIDSDHFISLKTLELLDLSHNNISNITGILDIDSSNFVAVLTIDLSFNSLENINFTVLPLKTVYLDLKVNKISEITGNVLPNVLTLSLASNNLLIPPPINEKLMNLDLSYNAIKNLDFGLFYSDSLRHLDLGNNLIQTLHENVFDNLTNLQILNLQNNQIDYIPVGLFQALLSLHYLNMSGNRLSEFEYGTFSGLKNVINLDISNNSLTHIFESTFHPLVRLTNLYVDHNLLTAIDSFDFLQHLKLLKYISLNNNPWICKILLNIVTNFHNSGIVVVEGTYKKTTNVDGIACFNYNTINKQFELSTEVSISGNNNWDKFNNFFNKGFFNTSFYMFFKNNTNLDFEQKLTNIFKKQIDETLNYTLFKFASGFKELEEEKISKFVKSVSNSQPVNEKLSTNFEERIINKMSDIQSNVLLLFVTFVIVLLCVLTLFIFKTFYKSLRCFAKENETVCVKTESNANLELL